MSYCSELFFSLFWSLLFTISAYVFGRMVVKFGRVGIFGSFIIFVIFLFLFKFPTETVQKANVFYLEYGEDYHGENVIWCGKRS